MTREKIVAQHLLSIKAVWLRPENPFTWSSGLKSPIYCDNRLIMSHPKERNEIIEAFISMIKEYFPDIDAVAGTATAGIPHAAWLADRMNLPMTYVRSSSKGHGKENLIEGTFSKGDNVLIIEDLISTGGSSLDAARAVEAAGGKVAGIAAIFTYNLDRATKAEEKESFSFQTLTTFNELIEVAREKGFINSGELELLQSWRNDPEKWNQSK